MLIAGAYKKKIMLDVRNFLSKNYVLVTSSYATTRIVDSRARIYCSSCLYYLYL
jgi:hypothetical protein